MNADIVHDDDIAVLMAGEINAVRVVDDAIEDGVGVGWIADEIVPFVDGDLTGDDCRSAAVKLMFSKQMPIRSQRRSGEEGCCGPYPTSVQVLPGIRQCRLGIGLVLAALGTISPLACRHRRARPRR